MSEEEYDEDLVGGWVGGMGGREGGKEGWGGVKESMEDGASKILNDFFLSLIPPCLFLLAEWHAASETRWRRRVWEG